MPQYFLLNIFVFFCTRYPITVELSTWFSSVGRAVAHVVLPVVNLLVIVAMVHDWMNFVSCFVQTIGVIHTVAGV